MTIPTSSPPSYGVNTPSVNKAIPPASFAPPEERPVLSIREQFAKQIVSFVDAAEKERSNLALAASNVEDILNAVHSNGLRVSPLSNTPYVRQVNNVNHEPICQVVMNELGQIGVSVWKYNDQKFQGASTYYKVELAPGLANFQSALLAVCNAHFVKAVANVNIRNQRSVLERYAA